MKFTLRCTHFVALILFLALISTQTGLAKGGFKGAFVKVVMIGPGMDDELVITDPTILEVFAFFNHPDRMMSRSADFKPGVELGEGYRIDRYLVENSVWDTLTYFPDPAGGEGYLYYNGSKYPAMTPDHGLWFRATPEGEAVIRQVIGAYLEPAVPQVPTSSFSPLIMGTVAGFMMFFLSIAFAARARQTRKAASST